jgi:diguanylate cyclase (GGDEF)-like protein
LGSWDVDKLTGALNRWGWDEQAPRALSRSRRHRESSALLLVDLDSFKKVNDRFGHLAGDAMLRSVATVLHGSTRGADLVGRFGGDEFVLFLPSTRSAGAMTVARRIRKRLRGIVISDAGSDVARAQDASACVGIALSDPDRDDDVDLDVMLADADAALLVAKRLGGDRTCLAQTASEPRFVLDPQPPA